jgi:hypothetical protein
MAVASWLPLHTAVVFTVDLTWLAWGGFTSLSKQPEGCHMTYMYPNFVPINLTAASLLEPGTVDVEKYGLVLYKEVSALCVSRYFFLQAVNRLA